MALFKQIPVREQVSDEAATKDLAEFSGRTPEEARDLLKNKFQRTTPGDAVAYMKQDTIEWYETSKHSLQEAIERQQERLAIAAKFTAVVGDEKYGIAEWEMASKAARNLIDGNEHLELSETYATGHQGLANSRHERAIQRLQPTLDEASKAGIHINRGRATTAQEVIKIDAGIGY